MLDFSGFMRERMNIWWLRSAKLPQPWTNDPILTSYQFTNIYRVLDRGSQFVLTHVIRPRPIDALLRTLVWRTFLREDTWDLIAQACGGDITEDSWRPDAVIDALGSTKSVFHRVYKFGHFGGIYRAHQTFINRIHLIDDMINGPSFTPDLSAAKTLQQVYACFRRLPMMGDFTAHQFACDLNYSLGFKEDHAPLGPGSKRGLALIGARSMREAYDMHQWTEFPFIFDRRPSIVDFEHALCEYAKYVALQTKSNNKKYRSTRPQPSPVFPESWHVD